ncbi:MAG: flagellar basal body-associated FliL family protein [Treponema sp.]|nr:flagellar basal body-associated FliL family protein [Treponema sp.]
MKLKLSTFDKILAAVIALLMLVIMCVTVITLATQKGKPGKNLRDADPEPTPREIENLNKRLDDKIAAYTGLGTIRCITAPDESASDEQEAVGTVVVITPWLAYPEGDTVFYEELARKRMVISSVFTTYFATRTKNQLLSTTEDKIKNEILEQINEQMSLGKISQIYFTDYIFLE